MGQIKDDALWKALKGVELNDKEFRSLKQMRGTSTKPNRRPPGPGNPEPRYSSQNKYSSQNSRKDWEDAEQTYYNKAHERLEQVEDVYVEIMEKVMTFLSNVWKKIKNRLLAEWNELMEDIKNAKGNKT